MEDSADEIVRLATVLLAQRSSSWKHRATVKKCFQLARPGFPRWSSQREVPWHYLDELDAGVVSLKQAVWRDAALAQRAGGPGAGSTSAEAHETENAFKRTGSLWFLAFEGQDCSVQHYEGMSHIHLLLEHQRERFTTAEFLERLSGEHVLLLSGDQVLDDDAKRDLQQELSGLNANLARAKANGDYGKQKKLQAEKEELVSHLRASVGLGNRDRRLGDQAKAQANRIGKAITDAFNRIERAELNKLARHLRQSIKPYSSKELGYCPPKPVEWQL